jgi:CheY-like chemotaxis protein/anti-sigma regulatory factor (Ser/Thr protein kinase)
MALEDNLGTVRADATKLRQALFNLLSNAAKFTENGEITVAARREELAGTEQIVLSVTDTGIGIAGDKLDRVFEEFAQAEETTTRDFGGTGLGLSISRRFCRMMGGDLSVNSVLGEGSTFTIVIPAQVDALEVARAAAELPDEDQPERLEGGAQNAAVLVIDDDADAREMLTRTFAAGGLEVATAADGEEGLRLARELQPGVITLDVVMPGMDGWAVLHALKQDPQTRSIPVVMVTIEDERALAFTLGATEYVTKPVDRELLVRIAGSYLPTRESKSVLVVEDDPPTRELVRRTLQDDGWQVLEACNGREGLDQVAAGDPDLVILDLMMPVMDGFDFLATLRAEERHRDLPVIVLTAMELNPEQMKYLESRAGSVLAKGDDELTTALELVRAALS